MFSQYLFDGLVVRALSAARVSVASQLAATFLVDHGHARLVVCGVARVCLFCRVRVHGWCAHVCHSVSLLRSLVTQGSRRGDLACRRRPFAGGFLVCIFVTR